MKRYQIAVQNTGVTFWCRSDQSVLDAMWYDGRGPCHYGCFGGGCGVCKIRVLAGAFDPFKRMSKAHISDVDREQGIVLSCCIRPHSDLVIESLTPVHHPLWR